MDNVTMLLQTAACTSRLLKRLEELLAWAWIRIKPAKSRSLSIRKGVRNDYICISLSCEKVPLLVHQPVQRRPYTADISDITSSTVLKMDRKANSYIKIWLGLPRGLSNVALFGRNILEPSTG